MPQLLKFMNYCSPADVLGNVQVEYGNVQTTPWMRWFSWSCHENQVHTQWGKKKKKELSPKAVLGIILSLEVCPVKLLKYCIL